MKLKLIPSQPKPLCLFKLSQESLDSLLKHRKGTITLSQSESVFIFYNLVVKDWQ